MYIWLKVKPQNIFEIHKRTLALCLKNKRKEEVSMKQIQLPLQFYLDLDKLKQNKLSKHS